MLKLVFNFIIILVFVFISYNLGFDDGADAAICVNAVEFNEMKFDDVRACTRANHVGREPYRSARNAWNSIVGDNH